MKTRILAFLLAVLMLLPLMAACSKKKDKMTVFKKGECKITYDANTAKSKDVKSLIAAIEETTGVIPEVVTEVTEDCQIIIGKVSHEAVQGAMADLRTLDYVAGVYDGYYVLGGYSDTTTAQAIRYFIKEVLPYADDKGELKVTNEENYHHVGKYTTGAISVGGMSLTHHSIVVPTNYTQNELHFAYEVCTWLSSLAGYDLPLVTADQVTTEGQIRVGPSICEKASVPASHGYAIATNGVHLELAAGTALGYAGLREVLFSAVFVPKSKVDSTLTDASHWSEDYAGKAGTTMSPDGDVRVMFSNMYGGHQGQHVMAPRTEMLTELYLIYRPAVLGLQEYSASAESTGFVQKLLDGGYRLVEMPAAAKTNGGQDATPLLYDPTQVEPLASGYWRFNNMTYEEYPSLLAGKTASAVKAKASDPSKGFDWGIFRMKSTGKLFMAASVHLWWKGEKAEDNIARKIQMQAMKDELTAQMQAFVATPKYGLAAGTVLPTFVGGDYNTRVSGQLSQMSLNGADNPFVNTNEIATNKLTKSTHHAYADYVTSIDIKGLFRDTPSLGVYTNPTLELSSNDGAIDHIFMNASATATVNVNRMATLTDYNAFLSSDHLPIYVDVSFTANSPVYTGTA